jgi:hypothetical protein
MMEEFLLPLPPPLQARRERREREMVRLPAGFMRSSEIGK